MSADIRDRREPGVWDGPPGPVLEGDALETALAKQIEYYFSRENLLQDHYLVQQMNPELFVPITVIATFKKVASMTSDIEIIKKVMRSCQGVRLNDAETLVRPNIKVERNTIILREIPSETPVEDVRSIFLNDKCGEVKEIHSDVGDTWFVKFEDEAAMMKTFQFLQSAKFQDKPIRCRIKAENLFRTLQQASLPAQQQQAAPAAEVVAAYYQGGGYPPMINQWPYQSPGGAIVYPAATPYDAYGPHPGANGVPPFVPGNANPAGQPNAGGAYRGGGPRRGGRGGERGGRGGGRGAEAAGARPPKGANAGRGARSGPTEKARTNINLHEVAHFPPLPAAKGGKPGKIFGYPGEFIKLSRDDICAVIKTLPPPERPDFPDTAAMVVLDAPQLEMEVWRELPASLLAEATPDATPPPAAAAPAPAAAPAAEGKKRRSKRRTSSVGAAKAHESGGGDAAAAKQSTNNQEQPQGQQQTPPPSQRTASGPAKAEAAPAPAPAGKKKGGAKKGGKKGGAHAHAAAKESTDSSPNTTPTAASAAASSPASTPTAAAAPAPPVAAPAPAAAAKTPPAPAPSQSPPVTPKAQTPPQSPMRGSYADMLKKKEEAAFAPAPAVPASGKKGAK